MDTDQAGDAATLATDAAEARPGSAPPGNGEAPAGARPADSGRDGGTDGGRGNGADPPEVGSGGTDQPAIGSGGVDPPAVGSRGVDQPAVGSRGADPPAVGSGGVDQPAVGSGGAKAAGGGGATAAAGTLRPAPAAEGDGAPAPTVNAIGAAVGGAAVQTSSASADGGGREEIPWLIIWSAIGVVLGTAAVVEFVLAELRVIELLVIASFLAVVLSPAVAGLVKLRIRRGLATTFVFFLGMAAFVGLGYLFIHPLYRQAINFANDLPNTLARAQAGKGRIGSLVARYHLQKDAATYIPKIRHYLSHLGGPALSVAKTVLSGLSGLVLLSVMTFLFLLEGPSLVRGVLKVLPPAHGRRARRILDDIAKSVTGYVIGNFATSVIAGVVCCIALYALGVPFALVFGVWVALVDLLPLVGGLLAGVPTVAFAFLHSPTAGIVTAIVFLVYQQLENHLLNPLIMSRTVKLNALWVLLSVLAGAQLLGFIGALLAIPAAGTIHVVARDIWDERRGRLKTTPTVGEEHQPVH